MFKKLQYYLNRKFTEQQIKRLKTNRSVRNFEQANKIGVLYNASNAKEAAVVKRFVQQLKSQHKSVFELGYLNDRKAESTTQLFTRKNLNWWLQPNSDVVQKFMQTEFDLLINAYTGNCMPLEYIAMLSKAKYRVGEYHASKTDCSDLMINQQDQNLELLLKQISAFLKKLNAN